MDSGKQQSKQIQRPTEPQENRSWHEQESHRREQMIKWHHRKRGYYLDLVQEAQAKKNEEA